LAVTDWRLQLWRLWFLALMTATRFTGTNTINRGSVLWGNEIRYKTSSLSEQNRTIHQLFITHETNNYLLRKEPDLLTNDFFRLKKKLKLHN